jgi:hypothetical protein
MSFLSGTNWDFKHQTTAFFIVTAVKTSNLTSINRLGSVEGRDVSPMRYALGFISQKTAFFIVTAVKTSNHTWH